jgi:hypothetical protein
VYVTTDQKDNFGALIGVRGIYTDPSVAIKVLNDEVTRAQKGGSFIFSLSRIALSDGGDHDMEIPSEKFNQIGSIETIMKTPFDKLSMIINGHANIPNMSYFYIRLAIENPAKTITEIVLTNRNINVRR